MRRYMTKRRKIAIRNKCCAIIFCISFTAGTALSTIFYQTNNTIQIPMVEVLDGITRQNLIILTNEDRISNNVEPLKENEKLNLSAEMKIVDMFENQYFEHNSPDNITPWYWIKEVGYDYSYAGENLAIDFKTANDMQNSLMKSELHKNNILNKNYTEIGIAIKAGIMDGVNTILVVYHFGNKKLEFKPLLSVVEPPEIKEKAVIKDSYDVPNGIEEVYDHIVSVTGNKGLDTELYLAIIKCESGFNPKARNSVSTATGIAQFTSGTWTDGVKWRGLDWTLNDRLDYKKSLDMMIWFIETRGEISRWECLKHI